jgi:protein SCO1/2
MMKKILIILGFLLSFTIFAETSRNPEGVYVEQKLNQSIDLNLVFLDEDGNQVSLKDFFQDKPVVIAPAYYECPRLCTLVYNGLKDVVENVDTIQPGKDYRIISVSFNPEDTPILAKEKAENYRKNLKKYSLSNKDWVFLVADPQHPENPQKLLNSMGYYYKKDGEDYSHPAAIIFLTSKGIISKYLYGIEFLTRDFRFALIEASQGKIGTPIDTVLLTCFRYDSIQGKYAPFAWGFMRLGGILILVLILGLLAILIFLEKRSKNTNFQLK